MDRKEVFHMLLSVAPIIHKTTVDKGFWPEDRNRGEAMMLIVSELGECLEAHRKDRKTNGPLDWKEILNGDDIHWEERFLAYVKDTVEDEMADVIIRFLDYCTGFKNTMLDRDYRKESTGNFGHDLLRINYCLIEIFETEGELSYLGKDAGYVLKAIIAFCDWWKIDITSHVKWKMRYNETRSHKHGKNY